MGLFRLCAFSVLLVVFSASGKTQESDNVNLRSLMQVGDSLFERCDYVNSLVVYQKGVQLSYEADSAHILGEFYTSAGIVYDYIGDYTNSLFYYQKAYSVMDSLGDARWKAAILNNIGAIYFFWEKYEIALDYYRQSLSIEKSINNKKGIGQSYENLGIVYRNFGQPDSALAYYKKSLDISTMMKDSIMIATSYNNIGNIYLDRGNVEEAIRWFSDAYQIQLLLSDFLGQVFSLNNLGQAYRFAGDYTKAIDHFEKAIEISHSIHSTRDEEYAYSELTKIAVQQGDYKQAFEYLQKSMALKDTLFNETSATKMAEMESRYELDKKNQEIEIKTLRIKEQDSRIRRERAIMFFVAIGLILSIVFGAIFMYLYRQKRSAYQVLLKQNIELARQELLLHEKRALSVPSVGIVDIDPQGVDEKYQKSSLTNEQKEAINEKLLEVLEYGRIFLRLDLSVEDLAERVGTNRRYLSQVINEIHETNFNNFINTYRVKEARRLLLDPEKSHFSLEGIASAAGFNSRISFNNAFKKITGLTPAYFQKTNKNINLD
ncbi:MAG: hypothetical protein CVU11_15460 [Bacteroidetes bacterium HGW-Bacteroidetes-6]|jgi:tetratricopeptide (TPR) repeat protein|nr:MAG: hypothetical protein CVU11_15460 [Bacteroidetes bacterium HGW-Bacteroidetes-6]